MRIFNGTLAFASTRLFLRSSGSSREGGGDVCNFKELSARRASVWCFS